VEKGTSVNDLEVGDRVGSLGCTGPAANANSAGEGNENLWRQTTNLVVTVDGGYEIREAPRVHALKIPDGLSCIDAHLFLRGVTVYLPCSTPNPKLANVWRFSASAASVTWPCKSPGAGRDRHAN